MSKDCIRLPVEMRFLANDSVRWRTNVAMTESCNITLSHWYIGTVRKSSSFSTDVDIIDDKGNPSMVTVGYNNFENGMSTIESLIGSVIMAARQRKYITDLIADESDRHEKARTKLFDMLLTIVDE